MVRESHFQYGNNFYRLFLALERQKNNRSSGALTYLLEHAETSYSSEWTKFLEENQDLLQRIFDAFQPIAVYTSLQTQYLEFLRKKDFEGAEVFAGTNNVDQIAVEAWGKLNILLQEAGSLMATYGIDEKDFYR